MLSMLTTSVGIAAFTIGAAVLSPEADGRQVGGGGRVAAGAYAYASPCAYQYGRWQATRSVYWRDLYYVCTSPFDVADEALD